LEGTNKFYNKDKKRSKSTDLIVRKTREGKIVALLDKARVRVDVALLKKAREEIIPIVMKSTVKIDSTMMKAIEQIAI